MNVSDTKQPRRVLMVGGTGTIGRATVSALLARGHEVVCVVRPRARDASMQERPLDCLQGAEVRFADVTDPASLAEHGFRNEHFDAVVSCLASRTGEPRDAWAIDHQAHMGLLAQAKSAGATQMVLLSAICVQRPRLAFQQAKLAFEQALMESGLTYSIVRPTAFFKSLSGQVSRVQQGKPYLVFGDGTLTACKPISDADLAAYLADCLEDPSLHDKILPIGGPGPAITALEQGQFLFELLGREPRFKQVPVSLISGIAAVLGVLGKVAPRLAVKAELARIGHYYATESMLVLDPETGLYDADATPETGQDTLFDYYRQLVDGSETAERGEHSVF
ncbi:epimerase [Thiocystis violacea]|nr:epimerase [Thiocystis violacea]